MLLFQHPNKVGNHHLQVAMFRCFSCKDPCYIKMGVSISGFGEDLTHLRGPHPDMNQVWAFFPGVNSYPRNGGGGRDLPREVRAARATAAHRPGPETGLAGHGPGVKSEELNLGHEILRVGTTSKVKKLDDKSPTRILMLKGSLLSPVPPIPPFPPPPPPAFSFPGGHSRHSDLRPLGLRRPGPARGGRAGGRIGGIGGIGGFGAWCPGGIL